MYKIANPDAPVAEIPDAGYDLLNINTINEMIDAKNSTSNNIVKTLLVNWSIFDDVFSVLIIHIKANSFQKSTFVL